MQEFRLKNIDDARIYFVEQINQNDLMSKEYKKISTVLTYIEHLF